VSAFTSALASGTPVPVTEIERPGWDRKLRVRRVPVPSPRPAFLANPRLRRTSAVSHYLVAASLEAIGGDAAKITAGEINLGVIVTMMSGCVNYSRRFYDETLRDPSTASPLVFPETVFNAPSSHLAALLGATGINYTLVGDPGTFAQGLALAADWMSNGFADAVLVVGAEENDWITADAFRLFNKTAVPSDGAGALYLRLTLAPVKLERVTDSHLFTQNVPRDEVVRAMRSQLPADDALLCDGLQNVPLLDAAEAAAWNGWRGDRVSLKCVLGEGFVAAAAWQCIAAVQAIEQGRSAANVSIVGTNQQAIGARFVAAAK
jgi:3-oxoacyl-(acyl-carrier-protein) synthase